MDQDTRSDTRIDREELSANVARDFRDMTALAVAIDTDVVTQRLSCALQTAFGNTKGAAKNVARAANSNLRAAENWLAGRNAPDAVHLLRLMATVPTFAAEVRRLTGQMTEMDPAFEQDLQRLFLQWQRMRDRDGMR